MSDFTSLVAISFLFAINALVIYYIINLGNQLGAQIATGRTVAGSPMPAWFRGRMLFLMWFPAQAALVGFEAVNIMVFLMVADHVSDAGVQTVAHLMAFLNGLAAAMTLMGMPTGLRQYYRNAIRQAEAD